MAQSSPPVRSLVTIADAGRAGLKAAVPAIIISCVPAHGHILAAANAIIAEDKARLGKTLFTRKGQGTPVELMSFRDGDAEAAGLTDALIAPKGEGARWAEMAVLYRNNFLSRAFEEALMRAKSPTASSAMSASTPAPRSRT